MRRIGKIKKEAHVLAHFTENKVLFVPRYTVTHTRARKLCRRMELDGLLTVEHTYNGFLYRRAHP